MYWQAAAQSFWCWEGWVPYLIIVCCILIGTAGIGGAGPLPAGVPQAIVSLEIGAVFLALYLSEVWRTPRHLAASPDWLQIQPRWGPPTRLHWEAIRVARHCGKDYRYKKRWVLECAEGDRIIKIGMLPRHAWEEFSAIIHAELSKRGRPVHDDRIDTASPQSENAGEYDP